MTHSIPAGRRAALHDAAFWKPLKGLVSTTASQFALDPETAGTLLYDGMSSGEIGHRNAKAGALDWIVTPTGAAMARRAGFSYDEHINWRDGTICLPGASAYPVEVYWPDVERLAEPARNTVTIEGKAETCVHALAPSTTAATAPPHAVRAAYSEAALAAWFKVREHSWPAEHPTPTENADVLAAREYFDAIPSRDGFRRIRQAKTSENWRKPGPRIQRQS